MSNHWPTIHYREFHDIPRAVVVEWKQILFLLDCHFDVEVDDYEASYSIYKLADDVRHRVETMGLE